MFVLHQLWEHCLAVKHSKCAFGADSVAYLGHVKLAQGVSINVEKIEAVKAWLPPCTVHTVRGFLGMMVYYHKFIRSYGNIVATLTQLLKREAFCWTPVAAVAFDSLKVSLTTASVLQLSNFNRAFIVDCNASGSGMGTVLHQDQGPITFFSRAILPHHTKLATYERELIGLVKAVCH
jgi:hypothetical protein